MIRKEWDKERANALEKISKYQSMISGHDDRANYTIRGIQGYLGTVYALVALGKVSPVIGVRIAKDALTIVEYT